MAASFVSPGPNGAARTAGRGPRRLTDRFSLSGRTKRKCGVIGFFPPSFVPTDRRRDENRSHLLEPAGLTVMRASSDCRPGCGLI